jgi:hypothetical protein
MNRSAVGGRVPTSCLWVTLWTESLRIISNELSRFRRQVWADYSDCGVGSDAPADGWHMLTRNEGNNSFEFVQQSAGTLVVATAFSAILYQHERPSRIQHTRFLPLQPGLLEITGRPRLSSESKK